MRNRYPGHCVRCRAYVEAGKGHPERIRGRGWAVRCRGCVGLRGIVLDEKQQKEGGDRAR